eukprot:CAMPEP_0203927492 /NCGR_PEP_ID=MMETSP0359-20131031/66897_1 /ASSEMBLY_ACC=CAM_ASM_000338 /TAXON_ID=268821 /ORGANISM="Scrippsiella Hangoei, Strain SHTV-5" /LENGTH=37 /DNA_ID= /DNA_START= /DNA_END= /DNA_ORIENTATION=
MTILRCGKQPVAKWPRLGRLAEAGIAPPSSGERATGH